MVCEKNTHAMTLAVVHEKSRHAMALGGSMCGLREEHTCNDTGGSMCGSWEEHTCIDSGDMWFVKRIYMQ